VIVLWYLAAGVLFIIGMRGLRAPASARRGNLIASAGMLLAVVVTVFDIVGEPELAWWVVAAGMVVGAGVGAYLALRVQMTAMPQLVAAFNGFGGGASALVAAAEVIRFDGEFTTEIAVTVGLSIAIGTVTLSGSFVAYGKLQGIITGRPIALPGGPTFNAVIAVAGAAVTLWAILSGEVAAYWMVAALALVLGVTGVLPIGGADMPVVISLLNSLSGVAAAMAGFVIGNLALIVGGALVGAAGLILTIQMSEAMNRSLGNILFSGFGSEGGTVTGAGERPVNRATPDDVAIALGYADRVVIVPGYGLAVAQAQHAVRDLADALERKGVKVEYAIHPVAGRMPGHMNVLLAEADVPYEALLDLDQANPRFPQTSVALVVGANDVVNPSARDDPGSPIYGMPILEVDRAGSVVVIKRSLSPGFAGIDNPLFYEPRTMMLFADGKQGLESIISALEIV
jgi:NAD(P) transhydrogenase subunit beta